MTTSYITSETYKKSEKDVETDEDSTAAPEEAATAVEGEQQPETCADLAQVTEPWVLRHHR